MLMKFRRNENPFVFTTISTFHTERYRGGGHTVPTEDSNTTYIHSIFVT